MSTDLIKGLGFLSDVAVVVLERTLRCKCVKQILEVNFLNVTQMY